MKRFLTALLFLLLIFLISWIWSSDRIQKQPLSQNRKVVLPLEKNKKEYKPKFQPQKQELKVPVSDKRVEVEVVSDESGVVITKIGGKEVHTRVSSYPVQRLLINNGLMTFYEYHEKDGSLKYQSVNLEVYLERLQKED